MISRIKKEIYPERLALQEKSISVVVSHSTQQEISYETTLKKRENNLFIRIPRDFSHENDDERRQTKSGN